MIHFVGRHTVERHFNEVRYYTVCTYKSYYHISYDLFYNQQVLADEYLPDESPIQHLIVPSN